MPAVVDAFRLNKDYAEVRQIQSDIVRQYEGDFGSILKQSSPKNTNGMGFYSDAAGEGE